jgi:hypothetical protein
MVDELAFFGIRSARDVATCLAGYGQTSFPRGTEWTITGFYRPQAAEAGYRLMDDAQVLRNAFVAIHNETGLGGMLEIPKESLTRAVEIVLKESEIHDASGYRPSSGMWAQAVRSCGYVQARAATGRIVNVATPIV